MDWELSVWLIPTKVPRFHPLGGPMKVLLGMLVAIAGAGPALAFLPSAPAPAPAPAPVLGVGLSSILAIIAAYVIAQLLIRHALSRKPLEPK
jgi:hypothetical protein